MFQRVGQLSFALLLLLLPSLALSAQEESGGQIPTVLYIIEPKDKKQDAALQTIITEAVVLQMAGRGIQTVPDQRTATEGDRVPLDPESLTELAAEHDAHYVLTGFYSSDGGQFQITLTLYDQQALASVTKAGKMGLTLDFVVTQALDDLLSDTALRSGDSLAIASPPDTETTEASQSTVAGTGEEGAPVSIDTGINDDPVPPPPKPHFEIATGAAPFVSTGGSSEFFKLGYQGLLMLNYRFDLDRGQIGLGLRSGMSYFKAEGYVTTADGYLIPAAVDVRYILDASPLGLFVHAGGGPAVLIIDADYLGSPQIKVMPYIEGGLGMTLSLSRTFGFALDLCYEVYFEGSVMVMGFSPALFLYFNF